MRFFMPRVRRLMLWCLAMGRLMITSDRRASSYRGHSLMTTPLGISVRKIWPIAVDGPLWLGGWIGGSLAVSLVVAALVTYFGRKGKLDAAIEIDHRFGLKERVSSCLSRKSIGPT